MKPLFFALTLTLAQAAPTTSPPAAREIAPGTFLLPGAVPADRGPDGNTVILVAPAGLDRDRHRTPSVAQRRHPRVRARAGSGPSLRSSIRTGTSITRAATGESKQRTRRRRSTRPAPSIGALAPGGFLVRNVEPARASSRLDNMPASEARRDRALHRDDGCGRTRCGPTCRWNDPAR